MARSVVARLLEKPHKGVDGGFSGERLAALAAAPQDVCARAEVGIDVGPKHGFGDGVPANVPVVGGGAASQERSSS